MDEQEAQRLLEEVDDIRVRSGLPRLDEASRRDFMKTLGKGAAAGAAMAAPGTAQAWRLAQNPKGRMAAAPESIEEALAVLHDAFNALGLFNSILNKEMGLSAEYREGYKKILSEKGLKTYNDVEEVKMGISAVMKMLEKIR